MTRRRWHKPLAAEDIALWEQVKASVTPLHQDDTVLAAPVESPEVQKPVEMAPAAPKLVPRPPKNLPMWPPSAPGPLQKHLKRQVARGAEPISERLDLHGMRQDEAHRQLLGFLRGAQARGARLVLVITGKGMPEAETGVERGVLRRVVPLWLGLPDCRELVAGFEAAHPSHGGAGALYIHVRKRRLTSN